MDYDGQRLLDVINDPNALESFLGGIGNGSGINNAANAHSGVSLDSTHTITQQQLASLQQQIQQQQQQLQQLQQQQHHQQQIHSPFSVPVRSPAPGTSPAATVILRSPAAPPPAASPSSLASSPAPNTLGHATSYSVSSPAPAPSPGPQQFSYRAVPSPQQRTGSLSSTPVASPINYPPGPGPGNTGQNTQSVQLPAGTITIPALATAVGQVQQLVSGGQVLQIVSAPPPATPPQVAGTNTTTSQPVVRHPVAAARSKQPQLRPKPANNSSPGPVQQAHAVNSPRTSSPVIVQQQQQQQQLHHQQQQQQQQQQQHQLQQQQQPQPVQQQITQQHATGQVVQLGTGGPTGTLVFSGGGNAMFPALAPTGGQFFLQQQGSGGFQLIVRPPVPSSSPPKQQQQQQSIVMQPQIGQTVHLAPNNNNRPATAVAAAVPNPPCHPTISQHHQPMVRLVTLPGLGTVQLQQIQTPNGPAFLAVQQPQQHQPQQQTQQQQQQPATFLRNHPGQQAFIQQHHVIQQQQQPHIVTQQQQQPHILNNLTQQPQQQQQQQQDNIRLVSSPATTLIPNSDNVVDNNTNNSTTPSTTFATPPNKKPPAKKKPKPKKKKEEVVVEEKKPAVQVNLAELLKQTGIVDDDESFFMDDEPTLQPPPPPPPQQQQQQIQQQLPIQIQMEQPIPPTETKENNMMLAPMLSEMNLIQTLHQHGLALSEDDLHTLRNFIKPSEQASEQSSALGGSDSLANGLKGATMLKAPAAAVSLTLGNGQVIQLTGEPFADAQQQPRVQFVTNPFDAQATQVFQAAPQAVAAPAAPPPQMTEVMHSTNHGFQNEFLEDLARSQIVSDSKKTKSKAAPVQRAAPANTNNNAPKKKPEPRKKKPPPVKAGANAGTNATGQTTPAHTGSVPRVQTIKLSPQNQQRFVNNSFPQNLRNIQAQIQYLTSKKDPTPQDTSLLQKLIEHHQKILATGKPVPTIPGQHAQGIPFMTTSNASNQQAGLRQIQPTAAQLRAATPTTGVVATGNNNTPNSQQSNQVSVSTSASISTSCSTPAASSNCSTATVTNNVNVISVTTTQSTIQSPMGTLILTTMDGAGGGASPTLSTGATSSSTTITNSSTAVASPAPSAEAGRSNATPARGTKRPAPPSAPPKPSISKSTLFEHQLKTDQSGALAPDCKTPFKNKTNACKRLVRYHVFHELGPTPQELEKEEEDLETHAQQLLSKFHQMINKYHYLLLMESTKEAPTSEHVMVERMFAGEEKQSLERLKEETRVAKELQLTPVWPVKSEPTTSGATATTTPVATNDIVNGRRDSPSEDLKLTPKMALLKFTRKEGEGYKSELQIPQEYKEVRVMVEDVVKSNGRIRESLEMNHSVSINDSAMAGLTGSTIESKPYDEWEAIQRELALYPDARDRDDMGFDGEEGGVIYDEDIKAQMQNAIDDLLRLNGCDDVIPPHLQHLANNAAHPAAIGAVASSSSANYEASGAAGGGGGGFPPPLKNGEQFCNNSEMQVDLALNEAVNSIL
ncbi:chromatin modification-related protein eaf-1-like isoform X4 [Daphnia pulex]|uniref:chromatin modification-related protein eaf-1-like isoform X4 n=1 Tax=Daphnia pulex TaxID=6669 RepID=UPI001EE10F46|nr:chromatin modification-related protein eaf-1-like isoform X4 [Daphnia pulex]XP_046439812.1 chromatin modification-related protein eaf-1-like isoform X4 [Daphnia pulex]